MRYFSLGQQWVLLFLALFILGILTFNFYYHSPLPPEETVKEIVVEVLGEIQKPGIYIFRNPPTIKEVLEKAGEQKETANFDETPSSEVLETGTLLEVRRESSQEIKIKIERMEANKLLVFSIPLDLNRVSIEDLCLVSEIGELLAREIVVYRGKRKGFRSVEELKNVKGIGEKKYQFLKNFFVVRHYFSPNGGSK
jgi:competence protein ComEA